jgi:hypothetical protein
VLCSRHSCQILINLNFLDILLKINIKFHENPSSGSRQTNDECNTRFWQFCESASANGCELGSHCQLIRILFVTTLVCFKDSLPHNGIYDESNPGWSSKTSCENVISRSPLSNSCGLQFGSHCSSWMRLSL